MILQVNYESSLYEDEEMQNTHVALSKENLLIFFQFSRCRNLEEVRNFW
jgi:hypothetical protein